MIGWFSTAMTGTFRPSLFGRVVFLGVRCCVALLLLCFLIVGIQMGTHTSRICTPLSPLMFFGLSWVFMGIASLTLHVYEPGSVSTTPVYWFKFTLDKLLSFILLWSTCRGYLFHCSHFHTFYNILLISSFIDIIRLCEMTYMCKIPWNIFY